MADTVSANTVSPLQKAYWRKNQCLILALLMIWFTVSFGFGILFAEPLNHIHFFGFKLGFWFSQQGAIFSFIGIIFIYATAMNRMDKKYYQKTPEQNTSDHYKTNI